MITVLVTGCGGAIGLCAAAGLRKDPRKIRIIGVDSDTYSAFFHFKEKAAIFSKTCLIPSAQEEDYVSKIIEICDKESVDAIFPGTDAELEKLSLLRESLEQKGTHVILSSPETVRICRDKWLTWSKLHKFVPFAKTALPEAGIEEALRFTGLPAIVKPRSSWGSRNVYLVNSVDEARAVVSTVDNSAIQTALVGEEYTVDCLANKDGKLLRCVPRKRLRIYGGLSFQGITVFDEEIVKLSKKITEHLALVGPFNFQLMKNNGKQILFEINARLAGTSALSIEAGVNLPLLAVMDALGMKLPDSFDFKEGLVLSRYFEEVYFREPRRFKAVIFDLDDTLFDEKQYVYSGFAAVSSYAAQKLGIDEKNLYSLLVETFQNQGRKNVFDFALKKLNVYTKDLVDDMVRIYRTHLPSIDLYDDSLRVLNNIRDYRIGLITNGDKKVQESKIDALGIRKFFNVILYADEYGGNSNIEVFSVALKKLGVKASESIYIDNNPIERLPLAKKSGIHTARLLKGEYRSLKAYWNQPKPDYEIENLSDILGIIGISKAGSCSSTCFEGKKAAFISTNKVSSENLKKSSPYVQKKNITVVISQPMYLPPASYFRIMREADVFVFLDSVQFEPRSWQCRNRVKSPNRTSWLSVPVKPENNLAICDTEIDNSKPWRKQHWHAINAYYGKAKFFNLYAPFFKAFYSAEWNKIALLNINFTEYLAEQLGISPIFVRASRLGLTGKRTKMLLEICKMFDADRYVSSIGSKNYMEENGAESLFEKEGINVEYVQVNLPRYPQLFGEFISELSVVDLLFNCGPDASKIIAAPPPEMETRIIRVLSSIQK